jgi:hypothetical protein
MAVCSYVCSQYTCISHDIVSYRNINGKAEFQSGSHINSLEPQQVETYGGWSFNPCSKAKKRNSEFNETMNSQSHSQTRVQLQSMFKRQKTKL